MKFKSLLFLPLLSIFILASCNNNNDPYKDKVTKDCADIIYSGDIKKEYKSGEKLEIGANFKVSYQGADITYLQDKEIGDEKGYYFCTSNEQPKNTRILPTSLLNTSKRTYKANIYIAVIDTQWAYVSSKIEITITNSQALSPYVYYIGIPVLIIACAGIVAFAKKYKEKHP